MSAGRKCSYQAPEEPSSPTKRANFRKKSEGQDDGSFGPERDGSFLSCRTADTAILLESEMRQQRKAEDALFSVLYAMAEKNAVKKTMFRRLFSFFCFTMIDFVQVIGLVVSIGNDLDPNIHQFLNRWMNVYQSMTQTNSFFLFSFWVTAMAVLGALIISIYVGYCFWRSAAVRVFPVKVLRILVRFLITAMYIFVLKTMMAALACSDEASAVSPLSCSMAIFLPHLLMSAITVALFVPYSFLLSAVYADANPLSTNLESRPHSLGDLSYLFVRTVLVLTARFSRDSHDLFLSLYFVLMSSMAVFIIIIQPYYRIRVNQYRAGLFAAAACFSLASLVLHPLKLEAALLPLSILALVSVVPSFYLGWFLTRRRHEALLNKHRVMCLSAPEQMGGAMPGNPRFWIEWEVEAATRFLQQDSSTEALDIAEAIYHRGLAQYPESAYVTICYAQFILSYRKDFTHGMLELKNAWSHNPRLDLRFRLSSIRREWEQFNRSAAVGVAGMNFVQALEFKQNYAEAQRHHNAALYMLRKFWGNLAHMKQMTETTLQDVPEQLERIEHERQAADVAYKSLMKKYANFKVLLRSYGSFLLQVCNDPDAAQLQFFRADQIEEAETKARNKENATDNSSSAYTSTSGSSSGMAAKKHRVKRNVLKLAQQEQRAVKLLVWAVLIGLVLISCIAAASFYLIQSILSEYAASILRLRAMIRVRVNTMEVIYQTRTNQLAITDMIPTQDADVSLIDAVDLLISNFRDLYLRFLPGTPSSDDAGVLYSWNVAPLTFYKYTMSSPPRFETFQTNLAEGITLFAYRARIFAAALANYGGYTSTMDPEDYERFRSLLMTAIRSLNPAIWRTSIAYRDEILSKTKSREIILGVMLGGLMAVLLALDLLAFRPVFKRVSVAQKGVAEILLNIPRYHLKQLAKVLSKAKTVKGEDAEHTGPGDHSDSDSNASSRGSVSGSESPSASPGFAEHPASASESDGDAGAAKGAVRVRMDEGQTCGPGRRRDSHGGHRYIEGNGGQERKGRKGKRRSSWLSRKKLSDNRSTEATESEGQVKRRGHHGRDKGTGRGKDSGRVHDLEKGKDIDTEKDVCRDRDSGRETDPGTGMGPPKGSEQMSDGCHLSEGRMCSVGDSSSCCGVGVVRERPVLCFPGLVSLVSSGAQTPLSISLCSALTHGNPDENALAHVGSLLKAHGARSAQEASLSSEPGRRKCTEAGPKPESAASSTYLSRAPLSFNHLQSLQISHEGSLKREDPIKFVEGWVTTSQQPSLRRMVVANNQHRSGTFSPPSLQSPKAAPPRPPVNLATRSMRLLGKITSRRSKNKLDRDKGLDKSRPDPQSHNEKPRPRKFSTGILKLAPSHNAQKQDNDGDTTTGTESAPNAREGVVGSRKAKGGPEGGPQGLVSTSGEDISKGPTSEGAAVSAQGGVLKGLALKYRLAFVLIALVAVANFVTCFQFLQNGHSFGTELMYSGERRSLAREALFYNRELQVNDSAVASNQALLDDYRASIEKLRYIDYSVRYGNSSLDLPGTTGRYDSQDKVDHFAPCVDDTGSTAGCTASDLTNDNSFDYGLVAVMQRFYELSDDVYLIFHCMLEGCHADPSVDTTPPSYVNRTEDIKDSLDALRRLIENRIDPEILLSNDGLISATLQSSDLINTVETAILAFEMAFLFGLYLFLFRPLIRRVIKESNRTSQLLLMIPKETVLQIPYLLAYFVRSDY